MFIVAAELLLYDGKSRLKLSTQGSWVLARLKASVNVAVTPLAILDTTNVFKTYVCIFL